MCDRIVRIDTQALVHMIELCTALLSRFVVPNLDNTYFAFANVVSVKLYSFAIAGHLAFVVYSLCFFIV